MSAPRALLAVAAALVAVGGAAPAFAAPSQNATVKVSVVKPLVLTWQRDLNLGTIVLGPGTWSGAQVSLSRTGTFGCGANLTCSGATSTAGYKVSGTNNTSITITAPNVTLVNQSDPTKTLTMVVDNPGTVNFTNSGSPGVAFSLGGRITLNSTTVGGTYSGTFNVTVDY